jgi:hypothetical protein
MTFLIRAVSSAALPFLTRRAGVVEAVPPLCNQ